MANNLTLAVMAHIAAAHGCAPIAEGSGTEVRPHLQKKEEALLKQAIHSRSGANGIDDARCLVQGDAQAAQSATNPGTVCRGARSGMISLDELAKNRR